MKNISLVILYFDILLILSCSTDLPRENISNDKKFYNTEYELQKDGVTLSGTLVMPDSVGKYPVTLIIAGSGPTDRNGNSTLGVKSNAYKMLSDTLASHQIASVRFDKRGISKSYVPNLKEEDLRFETYINDVIAWIQKIKKDSRFTEIIVLGHSEGALIGLLACLSEDCNAFISVSGSSLSADSLLIGQLMGQPKEILEESVRIIHSLKKGNQTYVGNANLVPLFRYSVQPYLISWFQYTPTAEISKLTIPCLIIHGSNDIQIDYKQAEELHASNTGSKLKIIQGMNHILKDSPADTLQNSLTYTNADLALSKEFCKEIINFIEKK